MVTDQYSHILDDDRKSNAELFERAFYSGEIDNPNEEPEKPEKDTESSGNKPAASGVDPELLAKILSNPEMAALLTTWRTVCINKRCQTTGVTYIESIVVSGLNRTRAQYSLYCHLSQQAHFGDLFRLKSMLSVRLGMGSKGRNRNVSVLAADLKIVIEHLPRQPHFGDLIRLRCVTPSSALKWVFAPIESNRSGK